MDECEFWELAAVLGANRPPDSGQTEESRRAWNAEQARRREMGLPQMEHAPSASAAEGIALAQMVDEFGV